MLLRLRHFHHVAALLLHLIKIVFLYERLLAEEDRSQVHDGNGTQRGENDDGEDGDGDNLLAHGDKISVQPGRRCLSQKYGA